MPWPRSRHRRSGRLPRVFYKLAARDLLFAAAVAGLWWLAGPISAGRGPAADFAGVLSGLGVAAAAYVCHEWGHLLGALATGSRVLAPERWTSISLFSFDSRHNSQRQFLVMSFSGFAVTGAALGVVYGLLPEAQLATRVARGGVLFLTSLTVFVELPLVFYALLSRRLPPVETFARQREVAG